MKLLKGNEHAGINYAAEILSKQRLD